MTEPMTEEMKVDIVKHKLYWNAANNQHYWADEAKSLIKLVRVLDSYRERDEKGRFKKVEP